MEEDNSSRKKLIRKRLRDGISHEDVLASWTQCQHYLPTKSRFCNLNRVQNSLFCGNHRPTSENYTARILKDAQANGFEEIYRIPCPIDPTHTIFNYNLDAHVKICNTGTRLALLEKQPYYCKDCNSGNNSDTIGGENNCNTNNIDIAAGQIDEKNINLEELVVKVRECYERYVRSEIQEPIIDTIPSYLDQSKLYKILAGDAVAFDRVRHALQDVQIVCQMSTESMFPSPPPQSSSQEQQQQQVQQQHVYVELGAGKGILGLAVKSAAEQCCPGSSSLVMVERSGVHRKADKTLRENSDFAYTRIRMDIRDCLLSGLPGIAPVISDSPQETSPPAIVLVAKHLCGLATDITLRSLESLHLRSSSSTSSSTSVTNNFYGVSIATCCHHACTWKDYINPEWILSCGITSQEFEVLTHWSGWAHTIGSGVRLPKDSSNTTSNPTNETNITLEDLEEHSLLPLSSSFETTATTTTFTTAATTPPGHISYRPAGITHDEMSEIGKMVKRLLDHGRVLYLRSMGFKVTQRRYCDRELSPECYLLLATRGLKQDMPSCRENNGVR